MKHCSIWLSSISDIVVRKHACHNQERSDWYDLEVPSLKEAVYMGFRWNGTPEGFEYWSDIIEQIENGTITSITN